MPSIWKMYSTTTEPPITTGNDAPSSVTMGIMLFRTACRITTTNSLSPFARAVRM